MKVLSPFMLMVSMLLLGLIHGVAGGDSGDTSKTVVDNASQLPSHTYTVTSKLIDLVVSTDELNVLASQVRADIESDLGEYDIRDKSEVRRLMAILTDICILTGDHETALAVVDQARCLQNSEAGRLMSGVITESIIAARRVAAAGSTEYLETYHTELERHLTPLPVAVVEGRLREIISDANVYTENLVMAIVEQALQPQVDATELISSDVAQQLISAHYMLEVTLPLGSITALVCTDILDRQSIAQEKATCAFTTFDLQPGEKCQPVIVGIWDTGVDSSLFEGLLYLNDKEETDGLDNDGNGFVDDVSGIAFDLESQPATGYLHSLELMKCKKEEAFQLCKGSADLKAGINSPEAQHLRQLYANISPDEFAELQSDLTLFGIYYHGTGVADVASSGNPIIRMPTVRNT
jgi:hypothetical protein